MDRTPVYLTLLLLIFSITTVASSSDNSLGWAQIANGPGDETIAGHLVLDDGSILVGGTFKDWIYLDDESAIGPTVGLQDDSDSYVAVMNSSGNWAFGLNFGSIGDDGIDALAKHPSGDIILSGHYCVGVIDESCELNVSSFTLPKDNQEHEGSAFIGRFAVVDDNLTAVWVRSVAHIGGVSGFDLAVEPNGDISVGLFTFGMLEIDNYSLGDTGRNLAILHYDQNGDLIWANSVKSAHSVEDFGGMCYSNDGHLHIAGTFVGSIQVLENVKLNSRGGADIFLAQYDSDGNVTWIEHAGGPSEDWANDCEIDSNGIIHVVGLIEETSQFSSMILTSNGSADIFHATANLGGDWQTVANYGGPWYEKAESIIIDSRNNLIIAGTFSSNFSLGLDELTDMDNDNYKTDVFVGQLEDNNQWSWAISAGGYGDDKAHSIQLDSQENPTIGIAIQNTVSIGNQTLTSEAYGDVVIWNYARDHDSDGFTDGLDNCPRIANPEQIDTDGDLAGDVCDEDDDGDSVADDWDDCSPGEMGWISAPNTDHDGDGCRDLTEDFDDDEDGILDYYDNCSKGPVGWISTIENDENQDGCEDVDSDGDGYVDQLDKCPSIIDDQADLDGDGIGDACENDTDGDGIDDPIDNCPLDGFAWTSSHDIDHDQDGCRDADRDADDDGDNVLDLSDQCPIGEINWNSSFDHDSDGCHDDYEDTDDDSDGIVDLEDSCPRGYIGLAGIGMDFDQDGCIDSTEDDDDDNDGIFDANDKCQYTPPGLQVDSEGCSGVQLDDDGDGVHNLNDLCPATPPGDVVSSTGCTVKTTDKGKSSEDNQETSYLIWILFGIAGVLVAIAAFVTFRPDPPKTVPAVGQNSSSTVNDGGGQGDGSTASTNLGDSGLDVDVGESEITTDES